MWFGADNNLSVRVTQVGGRIQAWSLHINMGFDTWRLPALQDRPSQHPRQIIMDNSPIADGAPGMPILATLYLAFPLITVGLFITALVYHAFFLSTKDIATNNGPPSPPSKHQPTALVFCSSVILVSFVGHVG